MTKIDKIEQLLKAGKKVTPLIAIQVCGAMRLAALIFDLKKRGHKIITTIRKDTQGNDYAEYSLKVGPEQPEVPAAVEVKELKVGGEAEVIETSCHRFPMGTVVRIEREVAGWNSPMFICSAVTQAGTQHIFGRQLKAL